ncbi:MAG: zinc ribbon domain-containing protein [Anaerolineae bacterium]|nr:zinc ribbon domain-containing protein [Anaerolineae bacterium]
MPIYEYRCQECGTPFEARRSMRDADTPIACPKCGSTHAKRGLSLFFASGSSGVIKGASGGSSCSSCGGGSCASCGGH